MSRPITAVFLRSTGPKQPKQELWHRHYCWMDTAMPRAVGILLNGGQVGDQVEFHFTETGFLIGTIKMTANNKIQVTYSELVESNPKLKALLRGF